ncbi:hypothetical protein RCH08_000569 [Janthinobacterium sp. CG_S6]|nr:hypothetical protein [Janthinobacterium sp. CG_S6]
MLSRAAPKAELLLSTEKCSLLIALMAWKVKLRLVQPMLPCDLPEMSKVKVWSPVTPTVMIF